MKLEQQVTSLEMSKKLKEAGFELDTPFYIDQVGSVIVVDQDDPELSWDDDLLEDQLVKAYTFQQLWEALPKTIMGPLHSISKELDAYGYVHYSNDDGYSIDFEPGFRGIRDIDSTTDSAAQAILWCIKNGYLYIKQLA